MKMKKFLNSPENITDEVLEGLAGAYPDKIKIENGRIVVRATPKSKDKVAVITMGGSGHEPALSGFVGEGMLDASVAGDIFAAPNAVSVLAALKMFKDYAGILLVVLNHAGDVMSANMALKMAAREKINVKSILVADDISAGLDSLAAQGYDISDYCKAKTVNVDTAEKQLSGDSLFFADILDFTAPYNTYQ